MVPNRANHYRYPMMYHKRQIRFNSIWPMRGSKNDDGGNYNSRTKSGIPLMDPWYIPLIQLSFKIQPMIQNQVHEFLDFTVKSFITINCYKSWIIMFIDTLLEQRNFGIISIKMNISESCKNQKTYVREVYI